MVSICLLDCMRLKHRMSLPPPLVRSGLPLSGLSCKMPLASTLVILGQLDGPVGVDPAYYIVRR